MNAKALQTVVSEGKFRRVAQWAAVAAAGMLLLQPKQAAAQVNDSSQGVVSRVPRGRNDSPSRADYTITFPGGRARRPNNFYNFGFNNGAGLLNNPYLYSRPLNFSRNVGPVTAYSDIEYGEVLAQLRQAGDVLRISDTQATQTRSILAETSASAGNLIPATVIEVGDRGMLVINTRQEIKLRGVRLPSIDDSDDVTRFYAREATKLMREMVVGKEIYLTFEEPQRDRSGNLLAEVFTVDGTEVNKVLIERGLGQVDLADFESENHPLARYIKASEQVARDARINLWSKNR